MRVYVQLEHPLPPAYCEKGAEIPIYDSEGNLGGHAVVIASFAEGQAFIFEVPDNDAGRMMLEKMHNESIRHDEVAALERLYKL